MNAAKISKIVINKFGEYHGEIILKNCTLINCVYLNSKEIDDLAIILKFMFASEISIDDFPEIENVPQTECPYVEIHIKTAENITSVMRKSYKNREFVYEIDGIETTARDFSNKLHEYGCLFSYTWFIKQKTIENLMTFNDNQRVQLIENICGNSDLKLMYNKYKTNMEGLEIEMKFLNDHKREFVMEKNLEKLNIENSKKIKEAVKEYENHFAQLALLKLYNNINKITAIPQMRNRRSIENEILEFDYAELYDQLIEVLKENNEAEKKVFISENSIVDLTAEIVECKKNLVKHQNELDSLTRQMECMDIIENQHNKIVTKLNESTGKLKELEDAHKKYTNVFDHYKKLVNDFRLQHPDYKLYELCRDQVNRKEQLKEIVKTYEAQHDLSVKEEMFYKQQLEKFQKNENVLIAKFKRLKKEFNDHGTAFRMTEDFIKNGSKKVTRLIQKDPRWDVNEVKMIEQKLREKFPGSIIGILCELFDVHQVNGITVTKDQIIKVLGDNSYAIVVENAAIVKKISEYLSVLQLKRLAPCIIIVPQHQYPLPKSLNDLQNKAPDGVKVSSLEEFLRPTSTEIFKILMHFLQPMAVCDCKSKQDVQKVFHHFGNNITVVSFAAGITFRPKCIIEIHPSIEDEYTLTEWITKITEKQVEFNLSRANFEITIYEIFLCKKQILTLRVLKGFLMKMQVQNDMKKNLLEAKIKKFKEFIDQKDDENTIKVRTAYEKYLKKFQPLLEQHFSDFCRTYKFQCIEAYQNLKFSDMIHKCHNETVASINSAKEYISKFLKNFDWQAQKEIMEAAIQQLKELESELLESIDVAKSIKTDCCSEWLDILRRLVEIKANYRNSKIKLKTGRLNIKTANYDPKLLSAQNYQLYNEILMDYESIPLSNGTLLDLANLPSLNDLNENFDLIMEQLNTIVPNFDALLDELKNANDVNAKIRELESTTDSLRNDLSNHPLDFGSDEKELASINERLNNLSLEIRNKNTECQKALGVLKSVTDERTKQFNECIKTINKEIEKYCKIIFDGQVTGELMPTNENEPYLEGLQYLWQSAAGSEFVNETSENWHASLAFMLGILSYKRQNFLAYFEESSKYPILYALQNYSASRESNLQSMVFWRAGIQEALCHNTIMRYNNKMNIVDNEAAARRLEAFLNK